MKNIEEKIHEIDALLPQTQCGLCGFKGCLPYATALLKKNAPIDLCTPGGVPVLKEIATKLDHNPDPLIEKMQQNTKKPVRVFIREAECIGCTKCIQVCPVDAILGAAKEMHTVLMDECTGCELCIPACPVDCIDLFPVQEAKDKKAQYKNRYQNRQKRLREQKISPPDIQDKKSYIAEAIMRAQLKK